MSGVVQPDRIKRDNVEPTLNLYNQKVLSKIPQIKGYKISGSYNSDMSKKDFGDIDLIVTIEANDLQEAKQYLIQEFESNPSIIPFDYKGKTKKYYNAGELVTVKFGQNEEGLTVQIDNIIALSEIESDFKIKFLNLKAEVQGLVLGLIKVAIDEFPSLKKQYKANNAEFDLSGSSIRLRTPDKEILWKSTNWNDVETILSYYGIKSSDSFEKILKRIKTLSERSRLRIIGLFKKMVSVKSGEVGTPKGDNKVAAIEQVEKLVEGKIKRFIQFI